MQERYLGDSHDFIKYALLRHLSGRLRLRLGVNWYLTETAHVDRPCNKDGGKRHHLNGRNWREIDPELHASISRFEDPANRRIENVKSFGVLPVGTFYHTPLLSNGTRADWHRSAQQALSDTQLVFLDPDNGFEVPSMTQRTAPKYALYSEAADFVASGNVVIGIQFARQCDPVARAREVRARLQRACGTSTTLPIIRARLAPNILFIAAGPAGSEISVRSALESFVQHCSKVELIE